MKNLFTDSQQKIYMSGRKYQPLQHGHGLLFAFCTLLSVTVFLTLIHAFYYDNKYIPQLSVMLRMRHFFTTPNIFARFENHPDLDDCDANGEVSESVVVNVEFARDNTEYQDQRNSAFNNPMFEDVLERGQETAELHGTNLTEKPYIDVELPSHSNEE
jgi:protein amnionless